MLPSEEKTNYVPNLASLGPPTQYGQITASMNSLLPAIQENQTEDPQRPSFKTITTLPRFQTQDSVRYSANQRFKVKKKNKKKKSKRHKKQKDDNDNNENENDNYENENDGYNISEDNEPYDIWHRPPITNEELNENNKQLILNTYENICNENFLELILSNETECDKLSELMCNKKLTSKDLSKQNKQCEKYQLFDILKLNDDNDDGGLNPDDYDIDIREMEHLFHKFNNNILNQFVESYFSNKLPFETKQPYPMGLIETDITKQRKIKTEKNKNYINIHRRKHKQRLREKHRKKKEKARKKRRKAKKMKMKLAQKKRDILREKLSSQLHPDILNTLFTPHIIDPNAPQTIDDDDGLKKELLNEEELSDDNLRTDDEALNNVSSSETKERIKNMRISRQKSRRLDRMSSNRHSAALQSPVIDNLKQQYSSEEWESKMELINNSQQELISGSFDDENKIELLKIPLICDILREINPLYSSPIMSKDYSGTIKRYSRPIKMDQIEKIYKYVLFKTARQYFGKIYLLNTGDIIENKLNLFLKNITQEYNQIKYQIESENIELQDICTNVIINNNKYLEIRCDFDINYYISLRKKRELDLFIQNSIIFGQESMLQLMSMGCDLDDIETDIHDNEQDININIIKQSFMSGDENINTAENKHDEDDENIRMASIIYDSDDDIINNKRWASRGKWIEKTLSDHCEKEYKINKDNPKPWKKLQSKYLDEFIHKFCGFYPNESRPIGWKRIWHQNMSYTKSTDLWPKNWMELYNNGKLEIIGEYLDELDDTKIKNIKCINQISGLWENLKLKYGKLFANNNEYREFYDRVLNNIPKLPLNLQDVEGGLPSFVWKLNECELSKYGTYLFSNWKQSSSGLVTTNINVNNANNFNYKFPIAEFRRDIEHRKWLSTKKWYIYRCRYWEAEDIEDFLDDVTKDGCEWFGSNDRKKHILIEDRICIQNDHCYGQPNLFIWTHDFCSGQNISINFPIKIRNYCISNDIVSCDPIIQSDKTIFNLNSPIIKTGRLPSDGPIKSGTKLPIGAKNIFENYISSDLNINGIIAIDCYIPPIFNLSVYNNIDTLYYNWNKVNHDNISDKASSKIMKFINKSQIYNKLINDENNILKSYDYKLNKWIDYKNYPKFDKYKHSHPSIYNNAFFFHNFLSRTFYYGQKNIAKINYPRNWQNAIFYDNYKNQPDQEWTFTFGFTHPRPIAPEKYAILLYKKDSIEVRITTDTHINTHNINHNYTDLTTKNIPKNEIKQFELINSANKYEWTQEKLEIMLNINYFDNNNNVKNKNVILFSEIIRSNFNNKDCFHEINNDFKNSSNKKFIFTENYFMSHVVIITKSKNNYIKCYLNGKIVCNKLIYDLIGSNLNAKNIQQINTNLLNINEKNNNILIAHKPGNKKGKVHGLFHGYLYAISLYSIYFQPFELNTLYRQLCVHRDLHVVDTWFNNKNQLSNNIYKQFL